MMNWYYQSGKYSDVVLNTKIKIARNIAEMPFLQKCSGEQIKNVLNQVEQATTPFNYNLKFFKLKYMDEITRASLVEKNILSNKFINKNIDNKAILINDDENICIMINDVEHLKIEVLACGLELENALNLGMEIEEKLDKELKFAYSQKFGYLTSSPTSLGTGLRASVVVHLPALSKTQNITRIAEAVNNFGMSIKSVYSEGGKLKGNVYQISNKQTLGICEQDIIKNLKAIVDRIIEQERLARKVLAKNQVELEDRLYRSFGILTNARKISNEEMIKLMSDVRLGVDLGIIKEVTDLKVNQLDILSKSANLQKYFGENLDVFDREIKRAELVKRIVKG